MKKLVLWILIVLAALAAVWAVAWPLMISAIDKDLAAAHGHPFKPITPAPGQPGGPPYQSR